MQFLSCQRELPAQLVVSDMSVLAAISAILVCFFNIVTVSKETVKSGQYAVTFCTCKKGEKRNGVLEKL